MSGEQRFAVELDGGGKLVIVADSVGGAMVADRKVATRLSEITASIEEVSRDVLLAVKRAGPTKAAVELGFGLAVESGQVVALFGKARGEATIKVTLEWVKDGGETGDASAGNDGSPVRSDG